MKGLSTEGLAPDEAGPLLVTRAMAELGLKDVPAARATIAEAERLTLSERDSLRVLALLENPPAAPERLVRAAKAGFTLP